ncbi:hypothetical protein ACF0H5_020148 [Mactra antiquata]
MLNLCFLSVKRWTVVSTSSVLRQRQTMKCSIAFILTISAWTLSLIISLPGLTSVTRSTWINGCFSPQMISDPKALIFIMLLHGLTLLILDTFCIRCIYILKRSETRVRPSINIVPLGGDSSNQTTRHPNHERRPRITHLQTIGELPYQSRTTGISNHTRMSQRRAFHHLLVAVVVINATTLPFMIIFLLQLLRLMDYHHDNAYVIDMQLMSLNSLLNPIVYGYHIREVRVLIIEKLLTTRNKFIGCFFDF